MSNQIEAGLNPELVPQQESLKQPVVTRVKGGRVIWRISGNTLEQNEQIIISNIWGFFLEKFPEFNDNFPRNEAGQIVGEDQRKAAEFILEKCGTRKKFRTIFGTYVLNGSLSPVLGTSYINILRKTFEPIGVVFKFGDFKNEQIFKNKSREEVTDTLRGAFLEDFPEFKKEFLEDGKVPAGKQDEARRYILQKIGSIQHFKDVFGFQPNISFRECVQDAFRAIGIKFRDKDFHASPNFFAGKSEEELINYCRDSFLEQFPEVRSILDQEESETKQSTLKAFILGKVESSSSFIKVFSASLIQKKLVPYFEGSFRIAVIKIFSRWNIELADEDFKRRKQPRPSGFWTPEEIEKEAIEFYLQEGQLTSIILQQRKRWDLINAFIKYYPGHLTGFRKKHGIAQEHEVTTISSDQANDQLDRLLEVTQ